MARPAGLSAKLKNNDNKHPRVSDEWQKGKRLGRPKQVWVADEVMTDATSGSILGVIEGHWEKV